ncbi:MAG: sugar porter family MFS transporter [Bacteroidota bacterium]
MKNNSYAIFLAAIVSLGGFLFGFDAAVISGVNNYITTTFDLTSLQLGWVVSSVTISSAASMLVAGAVSDRLGRKKVLIFVAFLYSLSAICSALAPSYGTLVMARLIGGIAFGAALVLVPVYIAETVPAEMRGSMVSINQLAIVVGFSAAYFSNYYFLQLSQSDTAFVREWGIDQHTWRWMLGLEALPALLYFGLLFFVPNSPRWLVMKGREDEALGILSKVNGPTRGKTILQTIQQSIEEGKNKAKTSISELFQPRLKLVMTVALIVGIAQMSVGINAVFFYATNIFELTGIGTDAAFVQSVWVGIINVLFTVLAILLIDRLGRRPLLLIGLVGVALNLLLVAYGFSKATYQLTPEKVQQLDSEIDRAKLEPMIGVLYDNDVDFINAIKANFTNKETATYKGQLIKAAGNLDAVLLLVGILGFVAFFAFSLGPVMWVLLSEIFPNRIRGVAISAVGFINSLTSYFVVQFFPWQTDNLGSTLTFLIYAGAAIVAFVLLYRLLPETKGRSLEELERELIG